MEPHQLPAVLCGGTIEAHESVYTLPAASLPDNLHKRLELLIA